MLGNILEFPTGNNNKIDKPNSISQRAKALYTKFDLIPSSFNWDILESSNYSLQNLKQRLEEEAFEYNASKQVALQEHAKPVEETPQAKQKKKGIFNIFG